MGTLDRIPGTVSLFFTGARGTHGGTVMLFLTTWQHHAYTKANLRAEEGEGIRTVGRTDGFHDDGNIGGPALCPGPRIVASAGIPSSVTNIGARPDHWIGREPAQGRRTRIISGGLTVTRESSSVSEVRSVEPSLL